MNIIVLPFQVIDLNYLMFLFYRQIRVEFPLTLYNNNDNNNI